MAPVALPEALARYYAALDAGRTDEAAGAFAPDALYVRPSLEPGPDGVRRLVAVEGRDRIRAWFAERGSRPTRHLVTATALEGDRAFVEGVVAGPEGARRFFLAVAVLAPDGLIARYAAVTGDGDTGLVARLAG